MEQALKQLPDADLGVDYDAVAANSNRDLQMDDTRSLTGQALLDARTIAEQSDLGSLKPCDLPPSPYACYYF